jgi:hypothetical protein
VETPLPSNSPHDHMILREWTWWAHTGGGNALLPSDHPQCDQVVQLQYTPMQDSAQAGWACWQVRTELEKGENAEQVLGDIFLVAAHSGQIVHCHHLERTLVIAVRRASVLRRSSCTPPVESAVSSVACAASVHVYHRVTPTHSTGDHLTLKRHPASS